MELTTIKAGDKRVLIDGKPYHKDFRIVPEREYQLLINKAEILNEFLVTLMKNAYINIT